ncbi:hypothetical protein F5051DRAFT_428274 [Lentinula edodes]|nr:hypothetical protein F5051DRAFT_428274 [Lentinula edodes]
MPFPPPWRYLSGTIQCRVPVVWFSWQLLPRHILVWLVKLLPLQLLGCLQREENWTFLPSICLPLRVPHWYLASLPPIPTALRTNASLLGFGCLSLSWLNLRGKTPPLQLPFTILHRPSRLGNGRWSSCGPPVMSLSNTKWNIIILGVSNLPPPPPPSPSLPPLFGSIAPLAIDLTGDDGKLYEAVRPCSGLTQTGPKQTR